jgi:hypothetical protein
MTVVLDPADATDRSDPAVRAAGCVRAARTRERVRRLAAASALVVLALAAPGASASLGPGAAVGGVVGSMLCCCVAYAVAPRRWTVGEERHHELACIWRQVRSGPEAPAEWDRYAAWVTADGERLRLQLVRAADVGRRTAGAPSPYRVEDVRTVAAEDVAAAAEAMEELRAEAAAREECSRQRHERERLEAERRRLAEQLASVDAAQQAELRAREEALRRELAEQERAEREAQAQAVARALRRP